MQSTHNCQRHLWLLAGTGDGPPLASALADQGWRVCVSVVSSQASLPYSESFFVSIRVGPLSGKEGIKAFLNEAKASHKGFDLVIDATHPFAVLISSELTQVCKDVSQPLIRYQRPLEAPSFAKLIPNVKAIPKNAFKGQNVLLALGSRQLKDAVAASRQAGANVFARVLPTPESLRAALACELNENNLAVLRPLKGEVFGGFESALCKKWSINTVFCRQSGGLTQRLWQEICERENMELWLISRPENSLEVETYEDLERLLKRTFNFP